MTATNTTASDREVTNPDRPRAMRRNWGKKLGLALGALTAFAAAGASYWKAEWKDKPPSPAALHAAEEEGVEAGMVKEKVSRHDREIAELNRSMRGVSRSVLELQWNLRGMVERGGARWREVPSESGEGEFDLVTSPSLPVKVIPIAPARRNPRDAKDGGP